VWKWILPGRRMFGSSGMPRHSVLSVVDGTRISVSARWCRMAAASLHNGHDESSSNFPELPQPSTVNGPTDNTSPSLGPAGVCRCRNGRLRGRTASVRRGASAEALVSHAPQAVVVGHSGWGRQHVHAGDGGLSG
jgi:hypothetical protein